MSSNKTTELNKFNFDEMAALFKENPEEGWKVANKIINDAISSVPDSNRRARLIAFQVRLDRTLEKYKNPIAKLEKMQDIFWTGVDKFYDVLVDPMSHLPDKSKSAEVIPFGKKKSDESETQK